MGGVAVMQRILRVASTIAVAVLLLGPVAAVAGDFEQDLARVDEALTKNPSNASAAALESCRARRNSAVKLHEDGYEVRAIRALRYCFQVLHVSEHGRSPIRRSRVKAPPSMEAVQAKAAHELEQALTLTPDVAHGLEIYRECAQCHKPEGFGLTDGLVPQIAGQHRKVVIKQIADIRAGNRDSVLMAPYTSVESIGGVQALADVSAYIDTLEMSVANGKGPGDDLELGARVYRENCARCHGENGEGNADAYVPRIQAQHYEYLLRQFQWIRSGKRRNGNPEMVKQIRNLGDHETRAVLDYVSRLEPPKELQAPPGWHNPDFAD